MHTRWQALLNGNVTQLSSMRLNDAKTIPAVDVMLEDGFVAVVEGLAAGLDIRLGQGEAPAQSEHQQTAANSRAW